MSFLSQENAQYISQILYDFLKDKHNIQLYDGTIAEEDYKKLLGNTMTYIYQRYNIQKVSMQDMNKYTISELKDNIISLYNKAKSEKSPEQEFVNKLQNLELQRQNFANSIPPPPQDIKAAEMVYSHPQSTAAPVQPPPNLPSIVYMPPTTKMGTEVNISSWQRDWIVYPKRNGFTWKGPLPAQLDITNVKIGCIITSKQIALYNPLLSIFIEGPNELDVHATIVLDKIVGEFAIYKPVTEALGLIYLLALPWKITLESGDGEELNLGVDRIPFKIIRSNPKTTVIQVTDLLDTQEGDSIRLYFENSKRILPSTVLSIQNNELEISGHFQHSGYLLNYTKQFTIIMETHSILQKK